MYIAEKQSSSYELVNSQDCEHYGGKEADDEENKKKAYASWFIICWAFYTFTTSMFALTSYPANLLIIIYDIIS